jgi:galactose mutarotase-like enzyme
MPRAHELADATREGFDVVVLRSPADLETTIAPGAGMVVCSLRHHGDELLGQRRGLRGYVESGRTFGIPILHPWANRLGGDRFAFRGVEVALAADDPLVHRDAGSGLPLHGLLAGFGGWRVLARDVDASGARVTAEVDFAAHPALLAAFPFPHRLRLAVRLWGEDLELSATITATGDRAVPVALGFHPWFTLPGVPRQGWLVALPVRRRVLLDARQLPTGAVEAVHEPEAPLGERTLDAHYDELERKPRFTLRGGGREIALHPGARFTHAQVFAPASDAVVCYEPMTAGVDPFAGDGPPLVVEPGGSVTATFSITVRDA